MQASDVVAHGYYWRIVVDGQPEVVHYTGSLSDMDAEYFGPLVPPSIVAAAGEDVVRQFDATNYDRLVSPRAEIFFAPNVTAEPSIAGKVLFHTEWYSYSGDLFRGATPVPPLEIPIAGMLDKVYTLADGSQLSAIRLVMGIKAAFAEQAAPYSVI